MKAQHINLSQLSIGRNIYAIHGGRHVTHPAYINDCHMAAYIAHGSGQIQFGDNKEGVSVCEGDIFLVNPDVEYRFIPEQGLRRIDVYFCFFSLEAVKSVYPSYYGQFPSTADFFNRKIPFIHSVDADNKEIRDVFIRMIDEQLSTLPCGYEMMSGYLHILLPMLFRNTKTRSFYRVYSKNRTVDEAIRYIHKRLYTKVSLDEIAEHLHVSPSFVCRMFKKHIGMTTSQFINMLRVEKIKDVLKNTDKPAEAVPEMFSFNVEYLKSVFKKETGMSMSEYKEKNNYQHHPKH